MPQSDPIYSLPTQPQPLSMNTSHQMPPLFLVNVISYWQAEGSSVLYPCPFCEGIIHIAEQTANEGMPSSSIVNIAVTNCPSNCTIVTPPQVYDNFHYVLVQPQAKAKLSLASRSPLASTSPPLLCSSNIPFNASHTPLAPTFHISPPSMINMQKATPPAKKRVKSSTHLPLLPAASAPTTLFSLPPSSIGQPKESVPEVHMTMPSTSHPVSIKSKPPPLSPQKERNLLSGFLRHLSGHHDAESVDQLHPPQPITLSPAPSNNSSIECWGTPHLLMGLEDPPHPIADVPTSPTPHVPLHSPSLQAQDHASPPGPPPSMGPHLPEPQLNQAQVVPPPLPQGSTRQGASLPIPPLPPRPKRPETLAHKVAWGWVDTIIKFLQVNRDRAKESPTVAQLAFKEVVTAITELEEQKNLISFDVITVSCIPSPPPPPH
ncbi:hypothetical protein OH76DRAFT_1553891, partial [Lentinus brumalis]